jgi:hypothetical protein
MPFLAARPDQDDQADLGEDVEAVAHHVEAEQPARDGERHGQHDQHGLDQALKLSRQHQEDDQQRQREGEIDRALESRNSRASPT